MPTKIIDALPAKAVPAELRPDYLETRLDPTEYQFCAPGAPALRVSDMSYHDLMQALCLTIDLVERFNAMGDQMQGLVRDWRDGSFEPTPPEADSKT
ncbi:MULTISPECIES: hypothetical protein [unclassified Variovorax]|uniref:hypothetical protein n=1 Tax=unclassified Variovorax TaxID=663243 RepID=UPI001316ECB4|nr:MULTISPECIES: hypothetical protein [unclassified Variovorax]VTU42832.1 hypothetical protein H6P1_00290 [Variovorax sp. PBL-H6]VTU43646.1 hypothetical protein SRS16P1_00614 [Variovorax sp. SRS16]VTU43710.1 hypothetical protein E5P1_00608 [Variovorax sp. PBL-E5]